VVQKVGLIHTELSTTLLLVLNRNKIRLSFVDLQCQTSTIILSVGIIYSTGDLLFDAEYCVWATA